MVSRRLDRARSAATKDTYESGLKNYLRTCASMGVQPYPVDETKLMAFCAFVHEKEGLRTSTLRSYVAAVTYHERLSGRPDPKGEGHLLKLLLAGCARLDVDAGLGTKRANAITHPILSTLIGSLDLRRREDLRLAAFMTLAYHGAFRASELVATAANGTRAVWGDVAPSLNLGLNRRYFLFQQKISKTKQMGPTIQIPICITGKPTCPGLLLTAYLKSLPSANRAAAAPLFSNKDGSAYTYQSAMSDMRTALSRCGYDPRGYSTHSFRVGLTTDAAMAGLPETKIKMLGRWTSEAYRIYIRADPGALADLTAGLSN